MSNRTKIQSHGLGLVLEVNSINNWKNAIDSIVLELKIYRFPKPGTHQSIYVEIPSSIDYKDSRVRSIIESALVGAGVIPANRLDKIIIAQSSSDELIISINGEENQSGRSKR
jgi:hypothetical protein